MPCSILYFDLRREDAQAFYAEQSRIATQRLGPGGSRNISIASSLAELQHLHPDPEIAIFDLYLGKLFKPEAFQAVQWLHQQGGQVTRRFSTNGIYALLPEGMLPHYSVQEALEDLVIRQGIVKDEQARIVIERLIEEHEQYPLR